MEVRYDGGLSRRGLDPPRQLARKPLSTLDHSVIELPQCLRLDLADALARHRELLADFLQRVVAVHADAKTHA